MFACAIFALRGLLFHLLEIEKDWGPLGSALLSAHPFFAYHKKTFDSEKYGEIPRLSPSHLRVSLFISFPPFLCPFLSFLLAGFFFFFFVQLKKKREKRGEVAATVESGKTTNRKVVIDGQSDVHRAYGFFSNPGPSRRS